MSGGQFLSLPDVEEGVEKPEPTELDDEDDDDEEVEKLRACSVDEDDDELRVFDSFQRLSIMESSATSAAASPTADDSSAKLPRIRSAEVYGSNEDREDGVVGSLSNLFVEPMDESLPVIPTFVPCHVGHVGVSATSSSSEFSTASTSSTKGEARKSPKRSLSSILDEDLDDSPACQPTAGGEDQSPRSPSLPADNNNNGNDNTGNDGDKKISSPPRRFSPMTEPPSRESPKRPPEDQPEEGKVSPKRLSFRPDRISSTSTPFGLRTPAKGVRALSFDGHQPLPTPLAHAQPPARMTRLSTLSLGTDYSLASIAENPRSNEDRDGNEEEGEGRAAIAEGPFNPHPSDQSSIIAHGFPSSFFYSPDASDARSTSGNTGDSGSKERMSKPGLAAAAASSPSTHRFREALSLEIHRRLSVDQTASMASSLLPYSSSPSKHPMLTRSSSSSSSSAKDQPEIDSTKWPVINKASLYSLYEALTQESDFGYWTRSRCRDITTESQLASGSQYSSEVVPSLTSSPHHAHHHVNAPFCCVPDTPSQLCLRRPPTKCKRETERLKEEEKARRKKEATEKIHEYLGNLKSISPSLWIGRRVGLQKVDVIGELNQVEPCLVQNIMAMLDDPSLKAFSLVCPTWSSAVQEHKDSRTRLQTHDDLVLAYRIQTRENTPLDSKTRAFDWTSGDRDNASIGHYSASFDLNRSFLGSDVVSPFLDSPFVRSAFASDQRRGAFRPVLRQASVNAVRPDADAVSATKQTRLSQSPRARSSRTMRSPRASTSAHQSPSRSGLQSPSRRTNNIGLQSPSRRTNNIGLQSPSRRTNNIGLQSPSRRTNNIGLQSPSRRANNIGLQSPSRRGPIAGNTDDPCRSPRSPFGRVLSPCRVGAQSAPRLGQRRLFTSPSKRDVFEGKPSPSPFAVPPDVSSGPASGNQIGGKPKLPMSALANHARSSPLPSSLESSSRRLFDSPTKNNSTSSGYDLRSQGTTSSTADAAKNHRFDPIEHGKMDAASSDASCVDNGGVDSGEIGDTATQSGKNSSSEREKTPLYASNYQPAPSALSSRRSLGKSHNKSLCKSKQKLRRL